MAQRTKQTPIKSCEWCGKPFARGRVGMEARLEDVGNFMRRRFCSISCSVERQYATEPPTVAASRRRATKHIAGSCACCGAGCELVIHHVDCNPMNNDPANLQTLCTYCHSFWHAMHRRLGKQPQTPMPRMVESENCADMVMQLSRKSGRRSSGPA
jgi:hypothetical protein